MRTLMLMCVLALPVLAQSNSRSPLTSHQAPATKVSASPMPVVTIAKDGVLKVDGNPINIGQLAAGIQRRSGAERGVYLRADKETSWNLVSQVLAALEAANPPIPVNLITQPSSDQRH
ncbi:MAG: ExbD/TolR family protein [Bryobacteraceae bacterium]